MPSSCLPHAFLMPPRAGSSGGDSPILSLRLSCDRCRTQKLKCSVPAGSGACQRCMRARVPCVFGRRVPSKRTNRRVDQASIRPPNRPVQQSNPPMTQPPNSGSGSATTSASVSSSTCPVPTPDTDLDEPVLDPGSSCHAQPNMWDSPAPALELHCLPSNRSECDWLQPGFGALDDGNSFELVEFEFDLPPWSQMASPPAAAAASWPTDSNNSNTASNNAVLTEQRLTALVLKIHQQLKKLEEGPWHTDSARSLDDYPVGTVLELSQQFCAIVGPVIGSTVCVSRTFEEGREGEDGDEDGRKTNSNAAADTADTPSMLLLMCGYMWLVRVYSVVMGHFWKHLTRMSTTTGATSPISGATATGGSALRLGELPCADAALALQQIHTAVRMLLDVLHDIEDHLGRGAMVARDKAVALLLSSVRRQNGSSGALGKKAAAIKELVREKMGL